MDALDLLTTRRSVRADDLVGPGPNDADLTEILKIAIRVPDHGRLTPWRLHVLRGEGQAKLGALCLELMQAEHPNLTPKQIQTEQNRFTRAPVVIAVVTQLAEPRKIPHWEQMLSGGAVCYGLLMAAQAMGFGAQWLTEWPAYRPEVVDALGHDPATDKVLGFVYIGSVTERPSDRPRPDLDAVVKTWPPTEAGAPAQA